MRYIFFLLLFSSLLLSQKLENFQSDFTQKVTSTDGDVFIYTGSLIASNENKILWKYTTPSKKNLYFNNSKVTIIEEDLEQVIITQSDELNNFSDFLQSEEKLENKSIEVNKVIYNITYKDKLPYIITYKDELENEIVITLTNQKIDQRIDSTIFMPMIPFGYDIISN